MQASQNVMKTSKTPSLTRIVVATSVGNALEWFDLSIYTYFAVYIARTFFPSSNETISILLTFASFGTSYLVRPLGGMVLGAYADRRGRRAALLVSLTLMMTGVTITALIPGYQHIGMLAPIAVLAARMLQGFSAGGEFGASTALLIEHAPERRGVLASWQFATQGAATLLASIFGFALSKNLSHDEMVAWGWRVPFMFGLLIGPIGLYLRRYLEDAPDFVQTGDNATPVRDLFGKQKLMLLVAIGAVSLSTVTNYMLEYTPTFAIRQLHMQASTGFAATIFVGVIITLLTPLAGYLSDRIGRLKQMSTVALLLVATVYPAFSFVVTHISIPALFALVGWLAILKAVYAGALPALMSEIFPVSTRATGMSVAYNVGVSLFGGFTPAIVTTLILVTGNPGAPSFYLVFTACLTIIALASVRHVRSAPLREPREDLVRHAALPGKQDLSS